MPTREELLQILDASFIQSDDPVPVSLGDMKKFLKIAADYHRIASLASDDIAATLITKNSLETTQLLAVVTYEDLIDCGISKGHARAMAQHMGGYADTERNTPVGRQAERVRQERDREDARSVAASNAITKSNNTEMATALAKAVGHKETVPKLNGGIKEQPTVKATMDWMDAHVEAVNKHQLSIAKSAEKLRMDHYTDVTIYVGSDDDRAYHARVRASMTTIQWTSLGKSEPNSALTLLKNVISGSVNKPITVLTAHMHDLITMGPTWSQAAVLGRLDSFENRLLEVRYSLNFDLQTAVDALLDVVAPIPSLTAKVIQAPGAATDQQQMDNLIMQLRTYAQICQTNTSKSKGSNQYAKMPKGGKGRNNSFSSGGKGKRRDHTGSTNNTPNKPTKVTPEDRNSCWNYMNTGSCKFGTSCKFSHGNSTISANATQVDVGSIVQQLDTVWQQRMLDMQHQQYQMMANMSQMDTHESECKHNVRHPWTVQVNGGGVAKVSKKKRTPSEMETLRKQMNDDSQVRAPPVGAVIDGAAEDDIIAGSDAKHCSEVHNDNSMTVQTVTGIQQIEHRGTLPMGMFKPMNGPLVKSAKRTLAALHKITAQGYTYVQQHRAAGLVKDGKVYECPPEGHFFRLPITVKESARAAEMRLAEAKFTAFAKERARSQALQRYKQLHTPKCLTCPDDSCDLGNIKRKPARRRKGKPTGTERGLVLGLDFITDMPISVNGNKNGLNISEAEHDLGWFIAIPDMTGASALEAFKEGITQILKFLPADKQFIARVHSDADKSIIGAELMSYLREKQWWQTTTEGYDHNGNSKVENRNGRVKGMLRKAMLTATGERRSYQGVWDEIAMHASNKVMLNLPSVGDKTPIEKAGGQGFDLAQSHIPGAKCVYFEAKERRESTDDTTGRLGVWLGHSDKIVGGHRIGPLTWNTKRMAYDIARVIDRKTVHVDDDCMILRMRTKKRGDHFNVDELVDRFAGDVEGTDVYEAHAIINHRDLDKDGIQKREYLVKWKGFNKRTDNTWQPEEHLKDYGSS